MSPLRAKGGVLRAKNGVLAFLDNSRLIVGNFQGYAKGQFGAFTGMWGHYLPQNDQLVATSSMRVNPDTFPAATMFSWAVTPDPDWLGVNGYLAVTYGNYDDSPGVITPRQVYTITDLSITVEWTFSGDQASGLLSECWLSPTAAPSGEVPKSFEIGFFPKTSPEGVSFLADLPLLGSFVDPGGNTWLVRQALSATNQPYFVAYPPGYGDFQGVFPYTAMFAFLIGIGAITGSEWFNGLAFGVEPKSGAGSLTLATCSTSYTGAARVPWTVATLAAIPQSATTVTLTWVPAAGATSHQYRINGGAWTTTAAPGAQTVTGLTAATTYTFEVRGVNGTGNGAASNTAATATAGGSAVNVVANGDFSAGDSGWAGFGYNGKSVTGGKALFAGSSPYDGISRSVSLTAGKYYELTWTVSGRTSGSVFPQLVGGSARSGTSRAANGTFTERLLANTGNNSLYLMLDSTGTLAVDNVSLVGPYNTATVGGA